MGFLGDLSGSLFGKSVDYEFGRKLQHDQQDFLLDFYGSRYQMEVEDLRKAGLNPILAAKFGGGGISSGGIANVGSMGNPMVASAQAAKARAETRLLKEQTESAKALADREKIVTEQKRREFEDIDEDERGRRILTAVESMPSFMRGPARAGVAAAKGLDDFIWGARKSGEQAQVQDDRTGYEILNEKFLNKIEDWFGFKKGFRTLKKAGDGRIHKISGQSVRRNDHVMRAPDGRLVIFQMMSRDRTPADTPADLRKILDDAKDIDRLYDVKSIREGDTVRFKFVPKGR